MIEQQVLIVVSGPPAAGKTTIALEIGSQLGMPVFSKDTIKESLHDSIGWTDLESSRRFGLASIMLMYKMLEVQLSSGHSAIAEMNFYAQYDPPRLLALVDRLGCRLLQVHCSANTDILVARYIARAKAGDRHPAHVDSENVDDLIGKLAEDAWSPLDLGAPLIRVDTSDFAFVKFPALVGQIKDLIQR